MKQWKIPICWQICLMAKIESDTLEGAMKIARNNEGVIPLPDRSDFIGCSWEFLTEDMECLRSFHNSNQEDEGGLKS